MSDLKIDVAAGGKAVLREDGGGLLADEHPPRKGDIFYRKLLFINMLIGEIIGDQSTPLRCASRTASVRDETRSFA